jgi:hypothetical protein
MKLSPGKLTIAFDDPPDAAYWAGICTAGLTAVVDQLANLSAAAHGDEQYERLEPHGFERIEESIDELIALVTNLRPQVDDDGLLERIDAMLGEPDVAGTILYLRKTWDEFMEAVRG